MYVLIKVHSTALSISGNLPSYPPDNHHSSDGVYWRAGGGVLSEALSMPMPVNKIKAAAVAAISH